MEAIPNGVPPLPLTMPFQQQQQQQHHMVLTESSGDDHELRAPKKRAETWVQDEIQTMLAYRKELESLFNTSKSNKHLWEQISQRMTQRGYDRSPNMCKDKWRNLLKDYRKLRHQQKPDTPKVGYYKDIEDVMVERAKHTPHRSPVKYESTIQMVPKDFDRPALNIDQRLDNDSQTTSLLSHESPLANGMSPWSWRDTSANGLPQWNTGMDRSIPAGRVIAVKWGDVTRRVGIDGSAEAIKDAIKSVFGLRSKRAFWLEDEDGVVRCFDRDMPLRTYNLHIDPGVTVKICYYDGSARPTVTTEERTLYCEDDLRELLARRGWQALREVGGYKDIDTIQELQPMCAYQQGGLGLYMPKVE